ncbi:MAG: copper resistance protein CopC [Methylococcaceae bacterium]|jgi:methionine-rich copper-binding protein CopC
MKKILILCTFFALVSYTNLASSHAVVTEYSLKIKPIHAHQADSVSLSFNSQIELALSRIFLVRKGDVQESLTLDKGKKQGQISVQIPALDVGDYALRLKVFAADGHLTEDVIHFSVTE